MKKLQKAIEEINKVDDILDLIPETMKPLESKYTIKYYHKLNKEKFEKIFQILKKNIKTFYENSEWGWNENEKKKEMKQKNMKYIIIYDSKNEENILGFSCFQFDLEENPHQDEKDKRKIVYLYELHISSNFQGKGLGTIFISLLEEISKKTKLEYIMLTNLKKNENSLKFYLKNNFEIDETSPSKYDIETDYEILSKRIKKAKRKTKANEDQEENDVKKMKI
eukprot:gene9961-2280_t